MYINRGCDVADYNGIWTACSSIVRLLDYGFAQREPIDSVHPKAGLVRTEDLNAIAGSGTAGSSISTSLQRPMLTIFVYRVDVNRTMRAAWSAAGHRDGRAHLPLDLHFLITPWASNAEHEYAILGRAMECLESQPILSGPLLVDIGDPAQPSWAPGDAIQISLSELTTEEVMRTFDSLPLDYKLSVPYVARIIRIDEKQARMAPPVTEVQRGSAPLRR